MLSQAMKKENYTKNRKTIFSLQRLFLLHKSLRANDKLYPREDLIPSLPNLAAIVAKTEPVINQAFFLKDTVLVCRQHLTTPTVALFESFLEVGFDAKNIHITGKAYSTSSAAVTALRRILIHVYLDENFDSLYYRRAAIQTVDRMWKNVEKAVKPNQTIIILDDGALCVERMPAWVLHYSAAIVEQTRGGLYSQALKYCIPLIREFA